MAVEEIERYVLGETAEEIELESREDNRQVATALVGQARRSVHIFTHDLERLIFDTEPFLDAVTRFARHSQYSEMKILLLESRLVVKQRHRLIDLSRRLSSSIQIRKPHPDYASHTEAFVVADARGYLRRVLAGRHEGVANFNDPLAARKLVDFFKEVWERSSSDIEMLQLHI